MPITLNADSKNIRHQKTTNIYLKGNDTHKESISFSEWSTVAVQWEYGGPWIYGVIVENNNTDHNGQSYILIVT